MRYRFLVYSRETPEGPSAEEVEYLIRTHGAIIADARQQGVLRGCDALKPTATNHGPRPIDLVVTREPIEHRKVNQIPHISLLPVAQTSPGRTSTTYCHRMRFRVPLSAGAKRVAYSVQNTDRSATLHATGDAFRTSSRCTSTLHCGGILVIDAGDRRTGNLLADALRQVEPAPAFPS
jgi:hypothetical protein